MWLCLHQVRLCSRTNTSYIGCEVRLKRHVKHSHIIMNCIKIMVSGMWWHVGGYKVPTFWKNVQYQLLGIIPRSHLKIHCNNNNNIKSRINISSGEKYFFYVSLSEQKLVPSPWKMASSSGLEYRLTVQAGSIRCWIYISELCFCTVFWDRWFLLQDVRLCCPLQYTTLE